MAVIKEIKAKRIVVPLKQNKSDTLKKCFVFNCLFVFEQSNSNKYIIGMPCICDKDGDGNTKMSSGG